jgi:hypothetical protein
MNKKELATLAGVFMLPAGSIIVLVVLGKKFYEKRKKKDENGNSKV